MNIEIPNNQPSKDITTGMGGTNKQQVRADLAEQAASFARLADDVDEVEEGIEKVAEKVKRLGPGHGTYMDNGDETSKWVAPGVLYTK